MTTARGLDGATHALTLIRPWTALMLLQSKNIENRGWAPSPALIGKRIALHAGLKFDDTGWIKAQQIMRDRGEKLHPDFWPLAQTSGAIVGTAVIVGLLEMPEVSDVPFTRIASDKRFTRLLLSPWFFGPYGWVLEDRKVLERPIPCRGAQKLWRIPEEVRR